MVRRIFLFTTVVFASCCADDRETRRSLSSAASGLKNRYEWEPSPQAPSEACGSCSTMAGSGEIEAGRAESGSHADVEGGRIATIVIASGSTGGTWLGQLLHLHPCTNSFRLKFRTNEDGKFRGFDSLQRLASVFYDMQPATASAAAHNAWEFGPRGVVVSAQQIQLLKQHSSEQMLHLPPYLKEHGIRVVLLTRDPLFWAVSRAKKRSLLGPDGVKVAKAIGCENRHQRGGDDCRAINATFRFRVSPGNFHEIFEENEKEQRMMTRLAEWLGTTFRPGGLRSEKHGGGKKGHHVGKVSRLKGKRKGGGGGGGGAKAHHDAPSHGHRPLYKIVRYEDLLCRSESSQGQDVLPPDLLDWIGLGNCGRLQSPTVGAPLSPSSVKSSPDNPLSAVANLREVLQWARAKAAKDKDQAFEDFRVHIKNRTKLASQTELSTTCSSGLGSRDFKADESHAIQQEQQEQEQEQEQEQQQAVMGTRFDPAKVDVRPKVGKNSKKMIGGNQGEEWKLGTMGKLSAAIAKTLDGESMNLPSKRSSGSSDDDVIDIDAPLPPRGASISIPSPRVPTAEATPPPPPPSLQLGGGYGDYAAADSTEPVGNDAAPPVVLSAKAATAMPKLSAAEKAARQKRLAAREQALTVPPADSEPESEASSEEKFQAAQERVRRQRAIQHNAKQHRGIPKEQKRSFIGIDSQKKVPRGKRPKGGPSGERRAGPPAGGDF
jgi:hypothetical protein